MARPKRETRMARCAASALLAAVEIYNKPTVEYREQTFCLLITNAWEILLKARLVQQNDGRIEAVYRRKGPSRRFIRDAATGEPITLNLGETLGRIQMPGSSRENILGISAVRNRAIHLGLLDAGVRKKILEFGTASVQNFTKLSSQWFDNAIEMPYLLPVGFIGSATLAKGAYPKKQRELLKILDDLARSNDSNSEYCVTMSVDIQLNRGLSGGGNIGLTGDPNSPVVRMTDDEALQNFPTAYAELITECKRRYSDFKAATPFYDTLKLLKEDPRCAHERKLDPTSGKAKSTSKWFYNLQQVFVKLDDEYTKSR